MIKILHSNFKVYIRLAEKDYSNYPSKQTTKLIIILSFFINMNLLFPSIKQMKDIKMDYLKKFVNFFLLSNLFDWQANFILTHLVISLIS